MSDTYLAVIAVAVVVIAVTQVAVAVIAVRAAQEALALVKRLEAEVGPVLEEVRSLSADAARSAALLAAQAERVDQLASRVTHRFDEFAASPLREGLSLVRMIVEAFTGKRQGGTQAAREPRRAPEPGGDDPPV
jgi:hypothetical protein